MNGENTEKADQESVVYIGRCEMCGRMAVLVETPYDKGRYVCEECRVDLVNHPDTLRFLRNIGEVD
jgi:formylmethanofuran dehydrogenase subunit E